MRKSAGDVTEWLAPTLNEALATPYRTTATPTAAPASHIPPPLRRGPLRTFLLSLAAVMAAGGIALFFTPLAPLGIYLLLGSVAPVGIAFGMQDKEFYV